MATLLVSKNKTLRLPSQGSDARYTIGVGWDPADPSAPADEKVDLDIWVIRRNSGVGEPICWANTEFHRPDLGTNSEGNPYIATPELDVIHKGDDTTGAVSDGDHDETVDLELGKAPATVDQYDVFITYFEEPNSGTGVTLGMATNIVCDLTDHRTGHVTKIELADNHGFDVTAHIATIAKDASGKWEITNKDNGFADSMFDVMKQFGVS